MVRNICFFLFSIFCCTIFSLHAQDPGGVTGSQLWLKADAGVSGVSQVSDWTDQSGASNHATQSTVSERPALTTGVLNYNPALTFDGSSHHLDTPLDINYSSMPDATIIAVYIPHGNNAGCVWGEDDSGWDRFIIDANDSSLDDMLSDGSGGNTGISNLHIANQPSITSVAYDQAASNGSSVYVNGTNQRNFTSTQSGSSNNFQVGAIGNGGYDFDGDIAEVIVYNSILGTNDRRKIQSYLGLKYGVTLAHDYLASDYDGSGSGTQLNPIWDATANSTYHNDVAGIGRDDNGGLDQRQSMSESSGSLIEIYNGDVTGGFPATNTANSNSFGADKSFLIWGNDAGGVGSFSVNVFGNSINSRVPQVWKVEEVGTVSTVSIRILRSSLPAESNYYLYVNSNNDNTFPNDANTKKIAFSNDGTYLYATVDFSEDDLFSIGSGCTDTDNDGVCDSNDLDDDNDGLTDIVERFGDLTLPAEIYLNTQTELYELTDMTTAPSISLIGSLTNIFGDIGVAPDATLYGIKFSMATPDIFTIDRSTAAEVRVGSLNPPSSTSTAFNALTFDDEGLGYTGNGSDPYIWRFDPGVLTTGSPTVPAIWLDLNNGADTDLGLPNADDLAMAGDLIFLSPTTIYLSIVHDLGDHDTNPFYLVEVTLDGSGNAIGQTVVGIMPNRSYGLAADDNGNIYTIGDNAGHTLSSLYKLDIPDAPAPTSTATLGTTLISASSLSGSGVIYGTSGEYESLLSNLVDADGDGYPDYRDNDSDNDGIPDIIEAGGVDSDGDGHTDNVTDTDGDGLVDTYDTDNGGTAIPNLDSDGDGTFNYIDLDADGDGILDAIEAGAPDTDGDGMADNATDIDQDGFLDAYDPDASDGPGGDGTNGTALILAAADGGDADTRFEFSGTNADFDQDDVPDFLDVDADNDGIFDIYEAQATSGYTPPAGADADGDGMDDAYDDDDANWGGAGAAGVSPVNTDSGTGDTSPDYRDRDSDGDGVPDMQEAWDALDDGDSRPDGVTYTDCMSDSDGDGLVDCFDSNDGSSAVWSIGVNPPDDDGTGGATTSTGVDATASNDMDTVFPNNALGSNANEPDWRDTGNSACATATTIYALTDAGTTYEWNGAMQKHQTGISTGIIRATTLCEPVGGWYRFYNPLEPGNFLFAIQNGTNTVDLTTVIDYIEIEVETTPITNLGPTNGFAVMPRSWKVVTKGSLDGTVNIRFYFTPTEYSTFSTAANTMNAEYVGGSLQMEWFKTDSGVDYENLPSGTTSYNGDNYVDLDLLVSGSGSGQTDGDTGGSNKNHVQFNGLTGFSGGTLGGESSGGALPVENLEFQVALAGIDAQLTWSTSQEINTDYFGVERSLDGSYFTETGRVQAAGNSDTWQNYRFTDQNIIRMSGRQVYYRLRQVDLDGKYEYSKVLSVNLSNIDMIPVLVVLPSQDQDKMIVRYHLTDFKNAQMEVITSLGQVIYVQPVQDATGEKTLNISNWSSGIYYINLFSENQRNVYKKVVIRN